MSVATVEPAPGVTDHALLVPLGHFAAQVGLLPALERVPFPMQTVDHSPGDKLAELTAHILSGGMLIHELEASPHPLAQDRTVAHAWGQEAFASASGVSELLREATADSVTALKAELRQVIAPYRQRLLRDLSPSLAGGGLRSDRPGGRRPGRHLRGADFGYMGEVGGAAKGYQFARAQVAGPKEALLLGGFLHSGHTVSVHCLAELAALAETERGRPRRRVEAVEQRLRAAEQELAGREVGVDAPLDCQAGDGARLPCVRRRQMRRARNRLRHRMASRRGFPSERRRSI